MIVKMLDPKATHASKPTCPSRLAQDPHGYWYCVDCGLEILYKTIYREDGCLHVRGTVLSANDERITVSTDNGSWVELRRSDILHMSGTPVVNTEIELEVMTDRRLL